MMPTYGNTHSKLVGARPLLKPLSYIFFSSQIRRKTRHSGEIQEHQFNICKIIEEAQKLGKLRNIEFGLPGGLRGARARGDGGRQ